MPHIAIESPFPIGFTDYITRLKYASARLSVPSDLAGGLLFLIPIMVYETQGLENNIVKQPSKLSAERCYLM